MTSIVNDNSDIDGIGLENHIQSPVPLKDDHEMEDKNPNEDLNESATRLPRLPSARLSRVSGPDNLSSEETNNGEPNPGPEEPPEVTDPAVLITELLESEESGKNDSDTDGEMGSSVNEDGAVHPEIVRQITTETTDTMDDEALWDTDLEMNDDGDEHDPTGRVQYRGLCDELGVVPISYFMRHITEPNITMRYHALGPTGAKAIALVLRDNVTLERLNIDGNCIGGEGGRAIARMLEENDYITEMSLAGNKLGSVGAECVCKMLHMNTGLRKISLAENNLTDLDTNMFVECLEHNKYLRDLDLSKNRFGQEAGEILGPAIASNDILERLDLSWNHLRLKGGIAVARGLQENVRLKTFRVAWNGLGPECGGPLAEAVATNNSLHELDISGNRLDMAAALAMAKSLLANDEIKILRMGNNLITTAGAITLVTAVNNNESSSLEVLDLTDVPVEFEFLRVVEDIRMKRPDFKVLHGLVLRSGNTPQDIGKPAIDPYKRNEPVLVLEEHIVVNDMRLLEILKRYDPDNTYSVSPTEFISALDELAVPYNRKNLEIALEKIPRGESGKIFFGDFYDQENRPLSSRATAPPETDVPEQ